MGGHKANASKGLAQDFWHGAPGYVAVQWHHKDNIAYGKENATEEE